MSSPAPCVLDASALLCLIFQELGADAVERLMPGASVSAANYAEVVAKLIDANEDIEENLADMAELDIDVHPLDRELASEAGRLRSMTRAFALSLGDRC